MTYANNAKHYPNGAINSYTYGNGISHKTTLNGQNLPTLVHEQKGNINILKLQYEYDFQGNVTKRINHVDPNYSLTKLTYDGLDRLTSTTGNSGIGSSLMAYDGLGNITQYHTKGEQLDYSYNTINNRLDSVTNANGSKVYNFNNGYDAKGNITNNGTRAFTYNLANQMTRATKPGQTDNTYAYDGHGRRIKAIDANGTHYSMYNHAGKLLFKETIKDGQFYITSYLFLGSKQVAEDGILQPQSNTKVHYKPFGDTIETPKDDIGYTGHKYDADINLVYMQQRLMDPRIGRFYSNDPVGYIASNPVMSFNRYLYVNNNPYKYTDPDGKLLCGGACLVGGGIAVARLGSVAYKAYKTYSVGVVAGVATGVAGSIALNESADNSISDTNNQQEETSKDKPRFIADSEGVVVDIESTPRGSYEQPDGGRTDVLQNEDHGAGRSHTHPPITNTNPKTGQTFVNGTGPGQPVTASEVENITSGKTELVKKGR